LDYFLGSVKLMLIVYALSAFIAMAVAWLIKMLFVGIRRRSTAAMPSPAQVGAATGKVS
jgi:hypothetical protein